MRQLAPLQAGSIKGVVALKPFDIVSLAGALQLLITGRVGNRNKQEASQIYCDKYTNARDAKDHVISQG